MEDFFAAICILVISLMLGFLVFVKVFLPIISSIRI
ncbi:putative membrane protein (plasmid) [Clostridium botulinum]|nr:putative membrane protein [Clostridium botulinum]